VSNPPAAKYTVMRMPARMQPNVFGTPATTLRIHETAISCPARMNTEPIQSSAAMSVRTATPYRSSR
jgi:hypothetical protein